MAPGRKRSAKEQPVNASPRKTRSKAAHGAGTNSPGGNSSNNSSHQQPSNVNNADPTPPIVTHETREEQTVNPTPHLVTQETSDERTVNPTPSKAQGDNGAEAESNETGATKRNTRGETKGYAVKKRLEQGGKIGGIVIEEDAKAPVGDDEHFFKLEMGVVVRVLAPIKKFFWSELTDEDKLPLFAKLEMVDKSLGKRYIQFKYRCHDHYKNQEDPVKARDNPHKSVHIDDWKLLCDHFDSPEFKRQSKANKANRAKVRKPHTTGAKSQSQRIYELNKKEAQRDATEEDAAPKQPPELQVYADTHKKRGGEWIHPDTQKNYEEMAEIHTQDVEQGNELTGVEIVEKVLKKKPVYAPSTKRMARERRLEAQLQAEREQREVEKESFERRSKQLEDHIEMQQQKIQSQEDKFEEMEESHNRLEATVRELAARMDQRSATSS